MARNYDVWCRSCGCLMKLKTGKFGEFYGCSAFPHCKNTLNKRDAAINFIMDDEEPTIRDTWED